MYCLCISTRGDTWQGLGHFLYCVGSSPPHKFCDINIFVLEKNKHLRFLAILTERTMFLGVIISVLGFFINFE